MSSNSFSKDAGWLNRQTPPHVVTLVLIAALAALNMNIFVPSLTGMAKYFEADYAIIQLAISAYLGVTAVLQLIIGPLSDRFGRRPVLLGSFGIFLAATLGCLFAPNVEIFLFFRMIQGAIASGMVLSRAVVRDMVEPDEAASKIGYITMGMSLAPMLGPMLGGFLEQQFGWHSSFVLVFVFGVFVTWLVWADLGETNAHKSSSFMAQFKAYPELFTSKRFWGYALTAAFTSGVFFAFLGGVAFVGETIFGLNSAQLGLYFMFVSTGYMFGNFLAGRFSRRIGLNRMMLIGSGATMLGMVLLLGFFFSNLIHPLTFFGSMIFVGIGNGMTLPNANAGIVSVRPHLAGSASGLGGAIMIGGGAALSATTGTMLTQETGAYPLLYMMLASAVLAVVTSLSVILVARRADELGREGFE